MSEFNLKVSTPEGEIMNEMVSQVVLETSQGQITLLPAHTNYTTILGAGVLLYEGSSASDKFVICGGFANFTEDCVTILTDSVDKKEDYSAEEVSQKLEDLEEKLQDADFLNPETKHVLEQLNRYRSVSEL